MLVKAEEFDYLVNIFLTIVDNKNICYYCISILMGSKTTNPHPS